MLINNDPFTFTICIVYLDNIYFHLVSNLTFKWQLCLGLPFYHISQDSYIPYLPPLNCKQDFAGGSCKDKRCLVFTGDHVIEALLYIEERCRKIASRTLLLTTRAELFNGFMLCLLPQFCL
jgi:hypothetical protein